MLSSTVDEECDINQVIQRFIKKLNGSIAHSFKKVRENKKKHDSNDNLFDKRRPLKNKQDDASINELAKVNETIADKHGKNYEKLKEELAKI